MYAGGTAQASTQALSTQVSQAIATASANVLAAVSGSNAQSAGTANSGSGK